ncbi:hypothetical protein ACWIUD_07375 [Helicobacter sp. 23-1044]
MAEAWKSAWGFRWCKNLDLDSAIFCSISQNLNSFLAQILRFSCDLQNLMRKIQIKFRKIYSNQISQNFAQISQNLPHNPYDFAVFCVKFYTRIFAHFIAQNHFA